MASSPRSRQTLSRIARQAMLESGLQPDFPPEALFEAERLPDGPGPPRPGVRDLTELPWRLLDQWMERWEDLVDFEVFPVMTSAEAAHAAGRSEPPAGGTS